MMDLGKRQSPNKLDPDVRVQCLQTSFASEENLNFYTRLELKSVSYIRAGVKPQKLAISISLTEQFAKMKL